MNATTFHSDSHDPWEFAIQRRLLRSGEIHTSSVLFQTSEIVVVDSRHGELRFECTEMSASVVNEFAKVHPEFFSIEPIAHNLVTCGPEIEGCLPLLLNTSPNPALIDEREFGFDEFDDEGESDSAELYRLYWAPDDIGHPVGWLVEVGGEQWFSPDNETFVPLVEDVRDLIQTVWAEIYSTSAETRVSDSYSDRVGEFSPHVGLKITTVDSVLQTLRPFEIGNAAESLSYWLGETDGRVGNGSINNAVKEMLDRGVSSADFPDCAVFEFENGESGLGPERYDIDDSEFDPNSELIVSISLNSTLPFFNDFVEIFHQQHPEPPIREFIRALPESDIPTPEPTPPVPSPTDWDSVYRGHVAASRFPQIRREIEEHVAAGRYEVAARSLLILLSEPAYLHAASKPKVRNERHGWIYEQLAAIREEEGRVNDAVALRKRADALRAE